MVQTYLQNLPHGVTLSCRACGECGRPVLLFVHGFPEAAFVWDELLEYFSRSENGGWRCVAPNLRGFERSSSPPDVAAYRAKHLVQDLDALIQIEAPAGLGALIAHDWGGAVAWNLANQRPQCMQRLVIINSPHPGSFLRELQKSPAQQAASDYMNFLVRPDAETLLSENDFARLWAFFKQFGASDTPVWLTQAVQARYREVWSLGLKGGCNYYRASPLRPAHGPDQGAQAVDLPVSMLEVKVRTLVLWGLGDHALLEGLLDGLEAWVPDLQVKRHAHASHWIVHEEPEWIKQNIAGFLNPTV
jgi:pimeloyl-ACP methyl ester carboxylesterase